MDAPSGWTWVHYKVLEFAFDCSHLPELTLEHKFVASAGGDSVVPATSRAETEAALLDLVEVGALDVLDRDARLTPEQAVAVVRDDSSWAWELRAAEVGVVDNDQSVEFLRVRPDDKNPHLPVGQRE